MQFERQEAICFLVPVQVTLTNSLAVYACPMQEDIGVVLHDTSCIARNALSVIFYVGGNTGLYQR